MATLSLPPTQGAQSLPSLRQLTEAALRQWRVFVGVAIAVALGMLIAGIWTPMYEAKMKVLVERRRIDGPVTPQGNNPVSYQGDREAEEDINSEIELLNSQDLMQRVVIEAGLNRPDKDWISRIWTHKVPEARATATAVNALSRHLKIEAIRKSNLISVKYDSCDPLLASKVLQILARDYLEKHVNVHRPHEESQFYDQESKQYKEALDAAQARLIQFDSTHRIAAPALQRDLDLQRGSDFDASSRQSAEAIEKQEARLAVLQGMLAETPKRVIGTASSAQNAQLLQQENLLLLNLRNKRTELLTKFAPGYAPVLEVEEQIASVEASIREATQQSLVTETTDRNPSYEWLNQEITKAQTELNAEKAQTRVASGSAGHYRAEAQNLDVESVEQDRLIREVKVQGDDYALFQQKREQAHMEDALDRQGILNVTVTEPPGVPQFPVRGPINSALMTVLLALTLGVPAAIGADQLRPRFQDANELAALLNLPVLATLPRNAVLAISGFET